MNKVLVLDINSVFKKKTITKFIVNPLVSQKNGIINSTLRLYMNGFAWNALTTLCAFLFTSFNRDDI